MSLALTPHGQGPHRRVREPGAWGPAPPPYLFADSRGSSADDSWRPSLCKSGDGRCFVLRLPGVMTRRPCGAQLRDDEALFSLGARGTLARCGLAATRRQPTGAPWGPAGGHRLCARHLPPPGSPTARCVRCAGMLLDGLHICGLCMLGATVVPMGMGCWLGAALRRLPLLRSSERSSNDFDWVLLMERPSPAGTHPASRT